jgi:hypothetical protein
MTGGNMTISELSEKDLANGGMQAVSGSAQQGGFAKGGAEEFWPVDLWA